MEKTNKPNDILRFEREKRGWSQSRIAELIGVDASMVSRWENGARKPDPFYREKLCTLLGKDANELGFIALPSLTDDTEMMQNEEVPVDSSPARFLTMGPEQLIQRYIGEKDQLLELKIAGIEWTIPDVIVIDNSKQHLPITSITIQLDQSCQEYKIPTRIAGKAHDILEEIGHYFYDSTTIRLNGIQIDDSSITLLVSKAHFLQYISTNYALDALLREKGWTRSLRDIVHPSTHLCKLEESLLANHIGVNALVFTSDNYLLIPMRSKENIATWQQTISPSISGATCYDDDMYSKKEGPVSSWIREGREELGISNSDFTEGSDIFLGLTRDLLRGGKPEMFFATCLNITKAQLEQKFKKARDRWENKELRWLEFTYTLTPLITDQECTLFLEEFLTLLNLYQDQLSRPAQVNLTFWFKYMWPS